MAEKLQGTIVEVSISPTGDELDADAPAGSTTLLLGDVGDFAEEGGILQIEIDVEDEDPETPEVETLTLNYASIDPEAGTVTLAAPLETTIPMNTFVYLYPRSEEKWAMVDIEGWDDALLARIPHYLHAEVSDEVRDPEDELSAVVRLDGTEWVVDDIIGDSQALIFGDTFGSHMIISQAGIRAYQATEDNTLITPTIVIDAETGNASFIGELGTNLPGEIGVFMFSTKFSRLGEQVTEPTVQFNVGPDLLLQPYIKASTDFGSGLLLSSGQNTAAERESQLFLDNGSFRIAIEKTASGDDFSVGPSVVVDNDNAVLQTAAKYGPDNLRGGVKSSGEVGWYGYWSSAGENQGMRVERGVDVRVFTKTDFVVRNSDQTSYAPVRAASFTDDDGNLRTKLNNLEGRLSTAESDINALQSGKSNVGHTHA